MAITRKDIVVLTRSLRAVADDVQELDEKSAAARCISAVADAIEASNPRFIRGKFEVESGLRRLRKELSE